jgi:hypothetical protein
MLRFWLVWLSGLLYAAGAAGQGFGAPPFMGGVPGASQSQAIANQRHLARTLLYQEALAELQRNPRAAEVGDCAAGSIDAAPCVPPAAAAETPPPAPGRRRALLVGNNRYIDPIPRLETPIGDVQAMAQVLRSGFGFEVTLLENAGKAEIVTALNRLARDTAPEDSALVVYAGHGYLVEETKIGYWIPSDASAKSAALWISNDDITRMLAAVRAHQVLLISDSCFSGSLAREQKFQPGANPGGAPPARTVLVFSSGDEEPVSDEGRDGHSIFAWSLLGTLGKTSSSTAGYEIYRKVHDQVSKIYPQEPQYGALPSAGNVAGGDYRFEATR